MAEGKSSSVVAMGVLCLLVVALQCEVGQAATHIIGGERGWTFGVSGWENGKKFMAGDVVVFNYLQGVHNVVAVNKAGYDGCTTNPPNAKVYTSGKDQIKLVKGLNNFICTFPTHCNFGMKIQILAS